MVDWRTLVFQTLTGDEALSAFVPTEFMYGAGGIEARPANDLFLVVRFGSDLRGAIPGVITTDCSVWVHDEPGDYTNITQALGLVKAALLGMPRNVPDLIDIVWAGDSPDLVDDQFHTFTRNSAFVLHGGE